MRKKYKILISSFAHHSIIIIIISYGSFHQIMMHRVESSMLLQSPNETPINLSIDFASIDRVLNKIV